MFLQILKYLDPKTHRGREATRPGSCPIIGSSQKKESHAPKYWKEPLLFPPQGGPPAGGNADDIGNYGKVGLPTVGRDNDGSGVGGGGDVLTLPP